MKLNYVKKFNKAVVATAKALVGVFCALCFALLLFTLACKRNADGAVQLFGYEVRVVLSASMEGNSDVDVSDYEIKHVRTGSMVFVQLVPADVEAADQFYAKLQVGDVLTFRYALSTRQQTITHRIIAIETKQTGGYIVTLRGDNLSETDSTDVQVIDTSDHDSPNYVVGKVVGASYVLGWIAYCLKQPVGLATLVILPCAIVIVCNVVKIVNILSKKEK